MIGATAVAAVLCLPGCATAPVQQQLTQAERGAAVWRMTCARCHNLRPANEFSDRQWPVIVNHMRTRQDLTRTDAQAVWVFLQELAGGAAVSD